MFVSMIFIDIINMKFYNALTSKRLYTPGNKAKIGGIKTPRTNWWPRQDSNLQPAP